MQVHELMSKDPRTCGPDDDLGKAAIEMWQGDCGMLPVLRGDRVIGVVTDRDICMGLALSGRRPAERQVQEVMSKEVFACTPDDDVGDALEIMGSRRIRRLPVVDGSLTGWLDVLTQLARVPATRVVPGHGPASAAWPVALEPQRTYLVGLRDQVRRALDQGLTLQQAVEQVPMPGPEWRLREGNHQRNVTAAYTELEWE